MFSRCFIHPPPLFLHSHSCASYVREAPGSVRHQEGNVCNTSAPPGPPVLTGHCFSVVFFLPAHTMGYREKKIVHMGGHDRQAGRVERRKNEPPPTPVLAPRPHAVSSRVTLPWKTCSCIFCEPVRSDPLPTELHPPLSVHRSSKARCLLLSEATHEININLTSDRML